MKVECQDGNWTKHEFSLNQPNNYCPNGAYMLELNVAPDNYVITIDNGTSSLGICIATVSGTLVFLGNIIREEEESATDFINKFGILLDYLLKTVKTVRYVKVEEPYNIRDPRFAASQGILKTSFSMIKQICSTKGVIFIPTKPSVWESQFIGKCKKGQAKSLIKRSVKNLCPELTLYRQDVYDAVGLMVNFLQSDKSEITFLNMNTSTKIKNGSFLDYYHVRIYPADQCKPDILFSGFQLETPSPVERGIQIFGYNTEFTLLEHLITSCYYRPYDIIVSSVTVDLKFLPVLYQVPNNLNNITEGSNVIIVWAKGGLVIPDGEQHKYLKLKIK